MFLRWLLSPVVSRLVMPAQFRAKEEDMSYLITDVTHSRFNVPSTGGAQINFREFVRKEDAKKNIKRQKIIIHAQGNMDFYENHLDEYAHKARKYRNCRIVGFNCRNVQLSEGRVGSEEDWLDDVIAVVNHYRQLGVPLKNILLQGESLGAAIVTMAAAKIYRQEKAKNKDKAQSVKVLNCRSFTSLTDVVATLGLGKILAGAIYGSIAAMAAPLTVGVAVGAAVIAGSFFSNAVTEILVKPWIKGILWLSFGTMDVYSAYNELPVDAKDYIMVKGDGIIRKSARLHDGLKTERIIEKTAILKTMKEYPREKYLKDRLQEICDRKLEPDTDRLDFFYEGRRRPEPHNLPLSWLSTYNTHRTMPKEMSNRPVLSGAEVAENKTRKLLNMPEAPHYELRARTR